MGNPSTNRNAEPTDDWRREARVYTTYLTGRAPSATLVDRYAAAMAAREPRVAPRDRRLLDLVAGHPYLLGIVDGGLALRRPHSVLRWKLLVMAAIVESSSEYVDVFLPQRRRPPYILYAGFVGVRAGLKGAIGSVLVSLI